MMSRLKKSHFCDLDHLAEGWHIEDSFHQEADWALFCFRGQRR
jgi:hypothetical protein